MPYQKKIEKDGEVSMRQILLVSFFALVGLTVVIFSSLKNINMLFM
ncbi:hypothetical protein FH5_03154 [Priestia endophytica]|nr:hypothetical protein FH5_03154 [Priestia endophytica]